MPEGQRPSVAVGPGRINPEDVKASQRLGCEGLIKFHKGERARVYPTLCEDGFTSSCRAQPQQPGLHTTGCPTQHFQAISSTHTARMCQRRHYHRRRSISI